MLVIELRHTRQRNMPKTIDLLHNTDQRIVAAVAESIWEMNPVQQGQKLYTVYGVRFINGPGPDGNKLKNRVEVHEKLGESYKFHEARKLEREAYYHEFTYIETIVWCPLPRQRPTYADKSAFVNQALRDYVVSKRQKQQEPL